MISSIDNDFTGFVCDTEAYSYSVNNTKKLNQMVFGKRKNFIIARYDEVIEQFDINGGERFF